MSAPWRAASALASRALARLPATSPTVGLSWATAMRSMSGFLVMPADLARQNCPGNGVHLDHRERSISIVSWPINGRRSYRLFAHIFAQGLRRMVFADRHRQDARDMTARQAGLRGPLVDLRLDLVEVLLRCRAFGNVQSRIAQCGRHVGRNDEGVPL